MEGIFGELGYDIVKYNHLQGKSPAIYCHLTDEEIVNAFKEIDDPSVECLVQFGATCRGPASPTSRTLAGKPVISINVVTYWHALRSFGIKDQFSGFTSLFSKF